MLHAVVMAGGSGTRFWPQSRVRRPKQLLTLAGDRSMIQSTFDRCADWIPARRRWVVTNAVQQGETSVQLPEVPPEQILIEPCARNTAPCLGLAAIALLQADPDATMLVMPADHVITSPEQFQAAVECGLAVLQADPRQLCLFGVKPDWPATGYGYIERGAPLAGVPGAYDVTAFREKPDASTAAEYVAAGRFYWNCGIFLWRADRLLQALAQCEPDMHSQLQTVAAAWGTAAAAQTLQQQFPAMKSISIDYAVLEHDRHRCVIEAPFQWDDVGSWLAVERLTPPDADGNTIHGRHLGIDTKGCIIRGPADDHLIATLGVSDLIIVRTADVTFVARKGDDEGIRQMVQALKARGDERYL